MNYRGSCHCGQVAFEADGEIGELLACNCSMCQRRGSLLWFIPRDRFRLLTKPEGMKTYTFNKHAIKHHFCPTSGIHPFAEGTGRDGKPIAAINARCIEGLEVEALSVKHFDGRAL